MRTLFVGDVMTDECVDPDGARAAARLVQPAADLSILGNLEVPLCSERAGSRASKQVAWRAAASTAINLREAGFAAMSLANNHTTDHGVGGLLETVAALEAAGVGVCGGGPSLADALSPWVDEAQTIALYGLSCALPPGSAAVDDQPGLLGLRMGSRYEIDTWRLEELPCTVPRISGHFSVQELEPVLGSVQATAKSGAVVVVLVHWGAAWSHGIDTYQLELAERLIDAGARLIVGHHSHTVGPVAEYADGVVCFGMGDWIRSPRLVAAGEQQRPGLAEDWRRFSRVGLALAGTARDGELHALKLKAVAIDDRTGVPTHLLAGADEAVLSGWLRWLGDLQLGRRPGWRTRHLFASEVQEFPLAAS